MSNVFDAAWVIARRDFVATVWSRTFLLFLLAPIIAIGFGVLIGQMTEQADRPGAPAQRRGGDGQRSRAGGAREPRSRLAPALGALELPALAGGRSRTAIPSQAAAAARAAPTGTSPRC